MFEGFETGRTPANGVEIAWVAGGAGPAVLLLHGFPQTHALWAEVGPRMAVAGYRVIAADLRGYGASGKPALSTDHASHSFRTMGRDMAALMTALGHDRFHLIGHDRGGRVAHRMALDHADRILSVALLDIVPTHVILTEPRLPVLKAYWHWTFLAQPAPFPETLIGHDPDHFFEAGLLGWGAARVEDFAPAQLAAYRAAWRDPETIAQMCHDYRAALRADLADDSADIGARIAAPALVLYGADGAMGRLYDVPKTWTGKCRTMVADALPGGHFFVDTAPTATAERLLGFLARHR
jgi:haloacetate dehalogenase